MSSTDSTTNTVSNDEQEVTTPTKKMMRVAIERHVNPELTSIKIDRMLTATGRQYELEYLAGEVKEKPFIMNSNERFEEIEKGVEELAKKIFAVPGIAYSSEHFGSVCITQYKVRIEKGRPFNDADVETGVLQAIAEMFNLTVDELDVRHEPSIYYGMDGRPHGHYRGLFDDDPEDIDEGEDG